jgi:hypothetical protein
MSNWFHSTEKQLSELADKVEKEAEKKLPPPKALIPSLLTDDTSTHTTTV